LPAQCEATLKKSAGLPMSVFERYLTVWVFLCIVIGIALGQFFPAAFQSIGRMEIAQVNLPVGLLIWVMIIPMLVKVDFGALHEVRQHVRGLGSRCSSTGWSSRSRWHSSDGSSFATCLRPCSPLTSSTATSLG
jgi:hypothetical protein